MRSETIGFDYFVEACRQLDEQLLADEACPGVRLRRSCEPVGDASIDAILSSGMLVSGKIRALSVLYIARGIAPSLPVGPVFPTEPVLPVGPVFPWIPCAPVGPVAPTAPVLPVGPVTPWMPWAPVGPVLPIPPVDPVGPVCP